MTEQIVQVSIVTPFYNPGAVFTETILSVQKQTLSAWEWIIYDDDSDDDVSLRLLEQLACGDSRVRVLRGEVNLGPGYARNRAVDAACASYIFQLDADDLIEPTCIEVLLWFLAVNQDAAFAKGYERGFGAEQYEWTDGFHSGKKFLVRNCVQTSAMVRMNTFRIVGGYDESMRDGCEDWDFWLRCAAAGLWGRTVPQFLHKYRRRPDHGDRWKHLKGNQISPDIRRKLRQRYPELWERNFPELPEVVPAERAPVNWEPPFRWHQSPSPKVRALILVPHFELGGADKFTLDLVSNFERRGFAAQTIVATAFASQNPWTSHFEGVTKDLFILNRFLRPEDYPRFISYVIESRSIQVVLIMHSEFGYRLLPSLAERFPTVRFLDYVHIVESQWKSGGYPRFSTDYGAYLAKTMASSHFLRKWMTEQGRAQESIAVVYTGVDTEEWRPGERNAQPALRVFFAGRLHEQKRPLLLLDIWAKVEKVGINAELAIAGTGPLGRLLISRLKSARLRRVSLLGALSPREMRMHLGNSDVLLLPSRNEGISVAAFEAMSMAVVPVISSVGGQSELVDGASGYLIETGIGEVDRYSQALLELDRDRVRLHKMQQACRTKVSKNFTLSVSVEQVMSIVDGCIVREVNDNPPSKVVNHHFTAVEAVEQLRIEMIADRLWKERGEIWIRVRHGLLLAADRLKPFWVVGRLAYYLERRLTG